MNQNPADRNPLSDTPSAEKKTELNQSATTGLKAGGSTVTERAAFEEIVRLIEQSRLQAVKAVNTTLIDLYWNVGEYISRKIQSDGWGKGTVQALSSFVQKMQPGIRGFSPQNIWRMRQFFETYRDEPVLSPLLRELPWSSNLHILSRSKRPEEREFYLRMASHNHWQVREVARQMDAALFERSLLNPPKLSTVLRELHPQAAEFFKDIYSLEFLGLPEPMIQVGKSARRSLKPVMMSRYARPPKHQLPHRSLLTRHFSSSSFQCFSFYHHARPPQTIL